MADDEYIPLTPETPTPAPRIVVPAPKPPIVPPITVPPITEPIPAPPPIPEPPGSPEALPDLGILSGLIVILGLILLVSALTDFFNWLTRFILGPFYKRAGSPQMSTQTLAQPLSNALGKAYFKLDQDIGLSFLKLASLESQVGTAILAADQVAFAAASRIA